jgi:2-dehydropantoate 2-reductase
LSRPKPNLDGNRDLKEGDSFMKHAVLGPGAIGGLVATALAHETAQVTLLVRPHAHTDHSGMLHLQRPHDAIEAQVEIAARLTAPVDVLWVAVKAHQLVAALHAVPADAAIGTIVPLLNGIEHVHLLRSLFTHNHVVPATILVSSERIAPLRIVQRSLFANLALSMIGEQRLQGVAERLRHAGFSCEFRADEKTMLWDKLAFLAPFALVGAASDQDKQGIFADATWRTRLEFAVGEVCAVAAADGAVVDRREILARLQSLPPAMRSSMQKDVSAGRTPELDAIGGAIIRAGRKYGIGVPAIRKLVVEIQDPLSPTAEAATIGRICLKTR